MPLRDFVKIKLQRRNCYRSVFNTPEGKVVLRDFLKFCGMGREPTVPDSVLMTGRNIGLQRAGQHIVAVLGMSDEEVLRDVKAQEDE